MDAKQLIKKIEVLPESIQFQVNDYIDFLLVRYLSTLNKIEEVENDFTLTDEQRQLLDESEMHHSKNVDKAKSGFEFLDSIANKYDYEI